MVAQRVHTSAGVEDACQNAWAILLAHPEIDLDHHGLRWLTTIVTRDAWTQARRERELPVGTLSRPSPELDELAEPAGPAGDPADLAVGVTSTTAACETSRRSSRASAKRSGSTGSATATRRLPSYLEPLVSSM